MYQASALGKFGFTAAVSRSYIGSMKEKTSITLSPETLAEIDQLAGNRLSRSAFIEHVLKQFLVRRKTAAEQARDLELLNKSADELNFEAAEVMSFQTAWEDER
jgi:predicted transcriptional regulator